MRRIGFITLALVAYFFLYKIYIARVSAFGCFDDCFSFAAGYFINKGKIIYSEIFYNHQLIPAFLSAFIQNLSHPINLYDLVLKHRQFIIFYGLFFNILIILRFGLAGFGFLLFYEFSKFYVFGDRFLAEGLIVYPLVYLTNLIFIKFKDKKLPGFDYFVTSLFLWFAFFARETFIQIYLLYAVLIYYPFKKIEKIKLLSLAFLLLLCTTTFIFLPLKDYYFNLVVINQKLIEQTLSFNYLIKAFFYPFYFFSGGDWNIFRILFAGLDIVFLILLVNLILEKKFKKVLLSLVILGLLNIRMVEPGRIFYDAFHMIPYFGIFISLVFILLLQIKNGKLFLPLSLFLTVLFIFFISSPKNFIYDKLNSQEQFINNYGNILQAGGGIKDLASPKDTLFVDGYDEAIYWVSGANSSYKYSMFTSVMPNFPIYTNARIKMFENNPPDIYYGSCPNDLNKSRQIPEKFVSLYQRLNAFGKPSCLFIKKDKLSKISNDKLKKVKEFGYEVPFPY